MKSTSTKLSTYHLLKALALWVYKQFNLLIHHLWILLVYVSDELTIASNSWFQEKNHKHDYKARLGHIASIAKPYNYGLLISDGRKHKCALSYESAMVVGPTGSGKTTKVLYKQLAEMLSSNIDYTIFVNNPSGEIDRDLAYFAKHHCGYDISVYNFSDPSESSGFNPLSTIRSDQDIDKISQLLVRSTLGESKSEPFWNLRSSALIAFEIKLVLTQKDPRLHNMTSACQVHQWISSGEHEKIDQLVVDSLDEQIFLEWKGFVNTPDKTLMSIVETASAAYVIFKSKAVQEITSEHHLDLTNLRSGRKLIFLNNSITDQKFFEPLNNIFWSQVYASLLASLPKEDDNDVALFLEEASSLYLDILPLALKNGRKYRLITLLYTQDHASLEDQYQKQYRSVVTNLGTKIYLAGNHPLPLLKELEELSGRFTYKDDNGHKQVRPNLSVEDIRTLKEGSSVIIHRNKPLIIGRHVPAFKDRKYKWILKLPKLERTSPLCGKKPHVIGEAISKQSDDENSLG